MANSLTLSWPSLPKTHARVGPKSRWQLTGSSRPSIAERVEIVGPLLHHPPPLGKVLRPVVCAAERISNRVGKLVLDQVRRDTQRLVEQRPRRCPEPVARHRISIESQPPEGRIDRVVAHRALVAAGAWEDVLRTAGKRLQLAKDRLGLPREGHEVRLAALHLLRRNRSQRAVCIVEVDFGPLGMPELSRADEDVRAQQEGAVHSQRPLVFGDRTQESAELSRACDCRVVSGLGRRQCSSEGAGRIAPDSPRHHGVAHHLRDILKGSVCRLHGSTIHDAAGQGEYLGRSHLSDGAIADVREHVPLEAALDSRRVRGVPRRFFLREPLERDRFERIGLSMLPSGLLCARVSPRVELLARLSAPLASDLESLISG